MKHEKELELEELRIALTYKCNMSCPHCYSDSGKILEEKNELLSNLPEFKKFLKESKSRVGLRRITLTGEEPLLPEIVEKTLEIVRFAKSIGIQIRIVSNGYFFNEYLGKKLVDMNVDVFQISLDSHKSEYHDKFRGVNGAFHRAVDSVKTAVRLGLNTHVRYSITPDNMDDVLPCYELVNELHVNSFVVKISYPLGRGINKSSLLVDSKDLFEIQRTLIEKSVNKETKVVFLQPFLIDEKTIPQEANIKIVPCKCGLSVLYIDPSGDVYPCNYLQDYYEDLKLGNLFSSSFELSDVWKNSRKLELFRNREENVCCVAFKKTLGKEYYKYYQVRDYARGETYRKSTK